MTYNPATDFVGLWRTITGGVEKGEIPGLDFVVAALGRAGLLTVTVSGVPPTANQAVTAWFDPANPSYSAEGALYLWNAATSSYQAATPALYQDYLAATFGGSGVSVWTGVGLPANTLGNNGDVYVRTDSPGGVIGPKTAGAWPVNPVPGTSYSQISSFLDYLGATRGAVLYRGAAGWAILPPGNAGQVLTTTGPGADPNWSSLSTTASSAALDTAFGSTVGDILYRSSGGWTVLAPGAANTLLEINGSGVPSWGALAAAGGIFDSVLGNGQGSVIYRNATGWTLLAPGTAGYVLQTNGASNNPSWVAPTAASVSSAALDAAFGSAVGAMLYRAAGGWTILAAGTPGNLLQTNGAGNAPAWVANPTSALGTALGVGSVACLNWGGAGSSGGTPTVGTTVTTDGTVNTLSYTNISGTGPATVPAGQVWRCLGSTNGNTGIYGYAPALFYRVS